MNKTSTKNLSLSALFLALCIILPFLTGQVPTIGNALLPMHIPVLLAGYVCGPKYATTVGAIAPLLRSILFGMPPMFPTAVAMTFELAAYGLLTGLLYLTFQNKTHKVVGIYISLIIAMLGGRVVWGVVTMFLLGTGGGEFTFTIFMQSAFITAIPGIIVQLILIPVLVMVLDRAKVINNA